MEIPNPYPWYDSVWLARYTHALRIIEHLGPAKLDEFEQTLAPFRTRPDFDAVSFPKLLDGATMDRLTTMVDSLSAETLELHEAKHFGRFVVHNQSLITELQQDLVDIVSEATGEPVEPCYNFLSLDQKRGVCAVHMDTPEAKYTLDLCIRQSDVWPSHISQVVPWPETFRPTGEDWETAVRMTPGLEFTPYELRPGSAILFSGSSQWHYRKPLLGVSAGRFCELVFFHYTPAGMSEVLRPRNWARLFNVPELGILSG